MNPFLRNPLLVITCLIVINSCRKGDVQLATQANDLFWVTNNGADMPVWVKGNTASKTIILVVHGGPGEGAYNFSDYETARLRENFGVAYWDQRDAGAAAGNNNFSQLSLPQMMNDLEAVVKVLKYRYSNPSVFLYAHSFGGLLAAAYLTKDSNQYQLNGWIDLDGAHNYPLCNDLSRQMLIDSGTVQIAKGHHANQWQSIVNYCKANNPNTSLSISNQIENYAHEAEGYMGIPTVGNNVASFFSPEDPTSLLANWVKTYYTAAGDNFNGSLQNLSYSDQLGKVTIPSLLLWGQYDFTVPPAMGNDALGHLGSAYKKLVLFQHSGHRPMQEDPDAVEDEIIEFVDQFK